MPAAILTTTSGYFAFTAVKLLGYTAIGKSLNAAYHSRRNPLLFGLARTAIGMAFGGAYWYVLQGYGLRVHDMPWWLGLIPLRVLEWWLLIRLFYDPALTRSARGWLTVAICTCWSYLLDLPAAFGFIMCGLSIC